MAEIPEVPVGGIRRGELLELWHNEVDKDQRTAKIYAYILEKLDLIDQEDIIKDKLWQKSENICKQIQRKWQESHSSLNNLRYKYPSWVQGYFLFDELFQLIRNTPSTSKGVGRPRSDFSECSEVTKRRKVQPLLEKTVEELGFATQISLRSQGFRTAATMVKNILESPENAYLVKEAVLNTNKAPTKLTPDEALASFIQKKLTKSQYIQIHYETKQHNADIYPIYNDVLLAKKRCYPENINITEISAEIKLQSLLDHTVRRLMLVQRDVLLQMYDMSTKKRVNIRALFKWGCDGASGHQQYKQQFSEQHSDICDDSFMFVISCVPLRLTDENNTVVWQNQRPSSTSFCRPIQIAFKKETEKMVREEVAKIKWQISQLTPVEIFINDHIFVVSYSLHLTMIDGKIANILTTTPPSRCFICKAYPKEMNNLESHSQRVKDSEALTFGMSGLHAWIKCFECILHISYKLEIKRWQAKSDDKESLETRKKMIQQKLRKEMGLLVDIPKPGFGTTNDGNTARRFFADPHLASKITGVDQELIHRLAILLRTIATGLEINCEKFGLYALETAKVYTAKYNWYYMPPTMHKLLIHGEEIIRSSIVPIGQMSEEAQEARHKDLKRFRRDHTRKMSRKSTMEDLMNLTLITSDPLISSLCQKPSKTSGPLPSEVLQMLKCPYYEPDTEVDTDSE